MLGRNLEAVVNKAMGLQEEWGDQFVSVEHLVLGLASDPRFGFILGVLHGVLHLRRCVACSLVVVPCKRGSYPEVFLHSYVSDFKRSCVKLTM